MKIVHICLACFFVDGMGYQENILPKYHSIDHDVSIITSDVTFDSTGKKTKILQSTYLDQYDIPVKVLKRSNRYGFYSRFHDYEGLYETLDELKPDVVFCHGGQFVALKDVICYCRRNKSVRMFIDHHADYYNTPVNTLRKRLGQYLIYGHWMRKAVRYTEKFWGVTPWRCQYLHDVYGIPERKIDFLPMGGDDEKIHLEQKNEITRKIREENDIELDDFLLITGGKIDKAKQIDVLMKAVANINREKIKLLVFGQPNDDMKQEIEKLSQDKHIRYIGWVSSDVVYDYFLAADLAVFPGTHSVLWEQACACGIPGIFRKWPGMHHIDVGGNVVFLQEERVKEMEEMIIELYTNKEKYADMKAIAVEKGINTFSYRKIAKKALLEE